MDRRAAKQALRRAIEDALILVRKGARTKEATRYCLQRHGFYNIDGRAGELVAAEVAMGRARRVKLW